VGFALRRCAIGTAALITLAACTSAPARHQDTSGPTIPTTSAAETPTATAPPSSARKTAAPEQVPTRAAVPPSTSSRPTTPAQPAPGGLPLAYSTGSATRVITVVASSTSSTVATLQAYDKIGGGWRTHGGAITAHLGSAGMSSHTNEGLSATPMGSFTLTEAFGRNANPGTSLPYRQTTPADWWISQSGPLYNTLQHCAGGCAFMQGDPNEHLSEITPFYNYAVVIDYNRSPVTQGAGSAFFLHVTDGAPTAGCVAIPQDSLTVLMQWLTPAANPRILIGVG
jgi:L,D-peptidoglycan transpeptidase YkuD (ErfK/YbiS/YcfS/YnhG family)